MSRPLKVVPTSPTSYASARELTRFVILVRVLMVACGLVTFILTLWLTTRSAAILETILIPTLLAVAAITIISAVLLVGVVKWLEHLGLAGQTPVPAQPLRYLMIRCLVGAAAGYLFALWYLRSLAR